MNEQPNDETQKSIVIQMNLTALQGKFFLQLQRLLDILAVSQAGLERVDEDAYSDYSPFLKLEPAYNQRLSKDSAVSEAKHWYLCTVVRDAIEYTNAFIEECWLVCSILSLNIKGTAKSEDYNQIVGALAKRFHSLGLPVKLHKLRKDFSVYSELEAHIISINTLRTCLVHRLGIVTALDADPKGELVITWRSWQPIAQSPDGTQEFNLEQPSIVKQGWKVAMRIGDQRKVFRIGDRIELSYREITHTILTLMVFASTLVQSIEGYGKRVGINFTDPNMQKWLATGIKRRIAKNIPTL